MASRCPGRPVLPFRPRPSVLKSPARVRVPRTPLSLLLGRSTAEQVDSRLFWASLLCPCPSAWKMVGRSRSSSARKLTGRSAGRWQSGAAEGSGVQTRRDPKKEVWRPRCWDACWGSALRLASTARADRAAGVTRACNSGISGSVASESTSSPGPFGATLLSESLWALAPSFFCPASIRSPAPGLGVWSTGADFLPWTSKSALARPVVRC